MVIAFLEASVAVIQRLSLVNNFLDNLFNIAFFMSHLVQKMKDISVWLQNVEYFSAHVRSQALEGWRFPSVHRIQTDPKIHSAFYKMSTGSLPGQRQPSIELATLIHPSDVALNMWTLVSTFPVDIHCL